jgi:rod shape-determining protein MreD
MTGIRLGLAILFTLLVQVALVNRMGLWGVRPDLTVLLIVFLGLRRGPVVGTLLGFFLGLLQDLLVPSTLGMNMLAKSCLGYLLGKLSGNLLLGGLGFYSAVIAISVLVHDGIYLLAYTKLDVPRTLGMFFTQSVPTALYTAVVGLVILAVATALGGAQLLSPREEGGFGR